MRLYSIYPLGRAQLNVSICFPLDMDRNKGDVLLLQKSICE